MMTVLSQRTQIRTSHIRSASMASGTVLGITLLCPHMHGLVAHQCITSQEAHLFRASLYIQGLSFWHGQHPKTQVSYERPAMNNKDILITWGIPRNLEATSRNQGVKFFLIHQKATYVSPTEISEVFLPCITIIFLGSPKE